MYRLVDAAMVRTTTHEFGWDNLGPLPELTGETPAQVALQRCWLERVWAQEPIAVAIEVASPALAHQVREVCAGRRHGTRQVRRAVLSVLRYLLRWTSRATPFGLFAGVAPARFGPRVVVHHGQDHHILARVDAEWLTNVVTRLESCPELRCRLPVAVNNLAFVRDGRLVVGCQAQPADSGQPRAAEVSVRLTRAVDAVARAARSPTCFGDLLGKLTAEYPGTPRSAIEKMLAELVELRILVTALRPPTTATDPLVHLLTELTTVDADAVTQVAPLVRELGKIGTDLSRHNNKGQACHASSDQRARIASRMNAVYTVERPLMLDLRVDTDLVLPPAVAREAEATAGALARLTPYPMGSPSWQNYHARYLDRYGVGSLVRVSDLVNADTELGFPAGYRDSRLEPPAPQLTDRDTRLLALVQRTTLDREMELVLDDQAISDLAAEHTVAVQPQPHTELGFQVHALTREALERGEFELAVTSVSRAVGAMTGRFLDLLTPGDRDRMIAEYARLPNANDDALPVQVSCPPLHARTENVARSPVVLPWTVSLAEHRTAGDRFLPLDDLGVVGDAQRLYLISLSQRRHVEPTVFNAIEFTNFAHPLLRLLCEISWAWSAACIPFSWGAASNLPFLPRLRYGRSILCPARWTLHTAQDLPARGDPWPDWTRRLAEWRHRMQVPDAVYLGSGDRHIRLDLTEAAHLYLLRSELDRARRVVLREAPRPGSFGWFDGRAHEIVVPLACATSPRRTRVRVPAAPAGAINTLGGWLPGASEWLYVKLYGHPDRHNAILTMHLPRLLSTWASPPQWWFLPYQDPDPHLRLRLRLPDADAFGRAVGRVGAWVADLRRLGLIGRMQIDTYYPETGRFGAGAAMTAAEAVFAADSATAIAQRTRTTRPGAVHQRALTAASLVDIAASFTADAATGMRWLIEHIAKDVSSAPAHDIREQAIELANPRQCWAALRSLPGGEQIAATWARRRTALATYRDTLTAADEIDPDSVLMVLLHLHAIRMAGVDPGAERVCHRLARAAALSWTARPQGTP